MARWARSWLWLVPVALACGSPETPATAQTPTQTAAAGAPAAAPAELPPPPPGKLFSDAELDELVARVALYPDPLLALVFPASTNAIQIVQAQRFLEANTGKEPPSTWDPAILSLLNYPEVVQMMNDDLDWTQALGDAVSAQQADVMDAVQQVRAQAQAAGNLETTKEQKVVVEEEVVKIVPADPEVIYVPRYDPQYIYAYAPVATPYVSYYPPRPCYWCAAATFGAGMFVGAAMTAPFWGFDWHRHDIGWGIHGGHNDFDFDIDRNINVNNNFNNSFNNKNVVNKGNGNSWKASNKPANRPGGGGSNASRPNRPNGGWNNPNRPGGGNRPSTQPVRPGQGGAGVQRPGGGNRPSTQPARPGQGGGGIQGGGKDRPGGVAGRPSTQPANRPAGGSQRPSTRPGGEASRPTNSMGDYGRGQDSVKQSQRGSSSRAKSSGSGSYQRPSGGSSQQRSSGGSSYQRSSGSGSHKSSMGNYNSGSRSSAHSSRGSYSRGGGGGGGGGGRGGGGGGGRRR